MSNNMGIEYHRNAKRAGAAHCQESLHVIPVGPKQA